MRADDSSFYGKAHLERLKAEYASIHWSQAADKLALAIEILIFSIRLRKGAK